jgi:hypothetical protein
MSCCHSRAFYRFCIIHFAYFTRFHYTHNLFVGVAFTCSLFGSGHCLCAILCVFGHRLRVILFDGIIFTRFHLLALPSCDFVLEHRLRAILFASIIFARFHLLASPLCDFVLVHRLRASVIKSHILAAKMKCITLVVCCRVNKASFSELMELPDFWFDGF